MLLLLKMLVKVNSINEVNSKVKVTVLDIDDYGSIIPLKELELNTPPNDSSILYILKNIYLICSYYLFPNVL